MFYSVLRCCPLLCDLIVVILLLFFTVLLLLLIVAGSEGEEQTAVPECCCVPVQGQSVAQLCVQHQRPHRGGGAGRSWHSQVRHAPHCAQ